MEWQRITEKMPAPTGENILLCFGKFQAVACYHNGAWREPYCGAIFRDRSGRGVSPTHWMPLPESPR